MSQPPTAPAVFSIGYVLSNTFEVIGRNILGFVLLAVLVYVGIVSLHMLSMIDFVRDMMNVGTLTDAGYQARSTQESQEILARSLRAMLQGAVVGLFSIVLLNAIVAYGTECDWYGERATLGGLLGNTLRTLPAAVIVALLAYVPMMMGFFLLVIPGLILMIFFWLVMPAAVLEGRWVSAFGRSWSLTKGARWKILGLIAILFTGAVGLSILLSGGFGMLVAVLLLDAPKNPRDLADMSETMNTLMLVNMALNGLIVVAVMIIFAVASAVSFLELRDLKEGNPAAADVFD